ncbi:conjugal transfer protein TrbA [Salmonella enterica]|uniref:Conjugal transfer protein TrbA n=2 Tax=Salmonella enterica TaxID=28901 RepID=A0A6W0P0E9_SALRU|nr:conjugal transfer protein TrbA [Salmonella enterica subsp. enterica serovar Rubislaw str. ATCC 10717]EAY7303046.1 conjugal transfer protein TrbA [Salmonella enterica]EBY1810347.1 conjugal transfer protein TrbA [Salmonella enterica subsp. enterica serovar Rubislaw]EDJ9214268.1 conjugal transfer protein TrbA [Salmonella enterica subsp. enterica serovar Bareilly]EIS1621550.1 conjugal transfer protein TrbA [Salmonella enterica subsp. enterica serovar Sandiego]HAE7714177.1 conjugal transfer prot
MLMALALILIAIAIFHSIFYYACCALLYYLWYLADFASIHTYVAGKINLLAWASNRVEDLSLGEFLEVMNQTAGILYVFMLPVTVYGLVATRNHPLSITRRKIDIHTLPKIMSTFSPAIIPALQYGDPKTQLLNVDPPEHRSAMTPDEFAISHKLVIGQRLDHERARQAFDAQLGTPLLSESSFSAHERALVAIIGLQVFCDDRAAALELRDTLNRSCGKRQREHGNKRGYPQLSLAEKAFRQVMATPQAKAWVRRHSTTRTALSALHAQDLRLPAGQFRWLKGIDRTLWYVLSSSDRSKCFVEGAGVVTAAQWESLVSQLSKKLKVVIPAPENLTAFAVRGLEDDLRNIGMVIDDHERNTRLEEEEDSTTFDDLVFLHNVPDVSDSISSVTPQAGIQTEKPDTVKVTAPSVRTPVRFSPH